MSAQQALKQPFKTPGVRYGNRTAAITLGVLGIALLFLAVSATWWLESDLELLGISAYMEQASTIQLWGVNLFMFSVPLAAILIATAGGLAARARGGRIALFAAVALLAVFAPIFVGGFLGVVVPWIFGTGGVLIELFLVGTIWFWVRERALTAEDQRLTLDLRMAGYGLFASAAWFVCGMLAMPIFGLDPVKQAAVGNPNLAISMAYGLLSYLAIGWGLVFASQYRSARAAENKI